MKYKKQVTNVLIVSIIMLLTSCKATQPETATDTAISDLINIDQNHTSHLNKIKNKDDRLIPYDFHLIVDKQFNKKFYSPWSLKKNRVEKDYVKNTIKHFKNGNGYGENKQKIPKDRLKKIEKNSNLNTYPNHLKKAITVANTNLRLLPTKKPYFNNPEKEGQGFPFDNIQNSAVAANTPIFITHMSKDRAWVLVETPFAHGWLPIRDIAYAGPKFIKQFRKYPKQVAAIKEEVPIHTLSGNFIYKSNIGMVFPRIAYNKYYYHIAVAMPSSKRFAFVKTAKIPRSAGKTKPMKLTIRNVANLSSQLLDLPYGWGGMYQNRDCSAMLKDLFTPFGIWLPRNSRAQAHKGGIYIDMSKLSDDQKEEMILNNGTPYLTLVWLPGHIMLYMGKQDEKPLVFHNIWGLRTTDVLGRKIIGKSVITTMEPGKSLPNRNGETLLKRVKGMTLLIPRYQA